MNLTCINFTARLDLASSMLPNKDPKEHTDEKKYDGSSAET